MMTNNKTLRTTGSSMLLLQAAIVVAVGVLLSPRISSSSSSNNININRRNVAQLFVVEGFQIVTVNHHHHAVTKRRRSGNAIVIGTDHDVYSSISTMILKSTSSSSSSNDVQVVADDDIHPAVQGWPDKYKGTCTTTGGTFHIGPRPISSTFDVQRKSFVEKQQLIEQLDIHNWPTWTTSDKAKWQVGNVVSNKIMPYSELSLMITGRLAITPCKSDDDDDDNTPSTTIIVEPGDLVTFPKDFCATWEVLEELTWYYYLY